MQHTYRLDPWELQSTGQSIGINYIKGVPHVIRYGVRSDLVDFVELTYNISLYPPDGVTSGSEESRGNKYVDLATWRKRDIDVSHPWDTGSDEKHGRHRSRVTRFLQSMLDKSHHSAAVNNATDAKGGGALPLHNLTMSLTTAGKRMRTGRNSIQPAYVDLLLHSKIVVVSQRDTWEGHYRLMEALALGAMVMTDPISSLPKYLEDGVSVVVYRSLAELREKIWHYLSSDVERVAIARRGHRIALDYHRSWHGLERVIFGNWSDPLGRRRRR